MPTVLISGRIILFASMFALIFSCAKKEEPKTGGGGGGSTNDATGTICDEDDTTCEENAGNNGPNQNPSFGDDGDTGGDTGDDVGDDDGEDDGDDSSTIEIPADVLAGMEDGHGCLQGIVTNGFTGQPIDLSEKLEDPSGVYVLIRGTKLKAKIIADDANLVGQYFICGIPLEETYPVFAFLDGFYAFESTVNISGTRSGSKADADVKAEVQKADPISRTNMALFPVDTGGRDFAVRVYHEGKAVESATVDVEPLAGSDHFAFEGTFANSANTRLFPFRATTGANGVAVFPADQMALGHRYSVSVTPPDTLNLSAPAAKELTFGISGAAADADANNYTFNFDLGDAEQALKVISCTPQGETYNSQGTIQVVFNRNVAIVNPNDWRASIAGGADAVITPDDPAVAGAESVAASVPTAAGGNTLTLRPKWDTQPTTPDYALLKSAATNADVDLTVTYEAAAMAITTVGDNTSNATGLTALDVDGLCNGFTIRFFREFEAP